MRRFIFCLLQGGVVSTCCLLAVIWSLQRISEESGLTEVGDDEVAVIYNQWTGSTREIDVPGNEIFLPFVERVCVQKRSPRQLAFSGEKSVDPEQVREVRFRTSDGSIVRFGALTVRSVLPPHGARLALEDWSGDNQRHSQLVQAYTRGIVADEYGRFSAEEIILQENQGRAHAATWARLNGALAPHGILIKELSTPKLRFDSSYEKSVEDRKLANQEVERLKAEFRQLEAERDQRLAALEKELLIQHNSSDLEVREYIAKLERSNRERRITVDQYRMDRDAAARNRKYQLDAQTINKTQELTLKANVFREEVKRMEQDGPGLIKEAWLTNLGKISFRLQPYSRDPNPSAIEVLPTVLAQ
jgi:hypothetical protein